jgi:hypothetical protein
VHSLHYTNGQEIIAKVASEFKISATELQQNLLAGLKFWREIKSITEIAMNKLQGDNKDQLKSCFA